MSGTSFSSVNTPPIKRSYQNLSFELKTSMNFGYLCPVYVQDVLPGDKLNVGAEIFTRCFPLLSPVMHRADIYLHFFFVPNRLVWDEWEEFITLGPDGTSQPAPPTISIGSLYARGLFGVGSLADYLYMPVDDGVMENNLPRPESNDLQVDLIPFRGYSLIYNDYYRDQNLVDEIPISLNGGVSGDDLDFESCRLRKRSWGHDYFTSSLPWAQKGNPVSFGLGGEAPVSLNASQNLGRFVSRNNQPNVGIYQNPAEMLVNTDNTPQSGTLIVRNDEGNGYNFTTYDPNGTLFADLSNVSAITVNELRRVFQLQRFLERNARAGSRYIESIYSMFHVVSSDARLQRSEYLGGGKTPIVFSEVLQTSESTSESSLGHMGGHGISVGKSSRFRRFFEEHGYVFGIMSIRPKTGYIQGLPRMYSRRAVLDYAFPVFAHLGEQEVLNKEVWLSTSQEWNEGVFGYQERYAEYRFAPNRSTGQFRTSLLYWSIDRRFSSRPALNQTFIECSPRYDIFPVANESEHHFIIQIYFSVHARRPLPKVGDPGYIDHF